MYHPDREPVFLDAEAWDDMNFCERKLMHIELAVGMMSDENQLQRQQFIQKAQIDLYQMVQGMVQAGTLTPEMYRKIKKPFEDTLYVLGVKDCNTYLPTDQEVEQMISQGQAAQKTREPSPEDQKNISQAHLNQARAQQITAEVTGQDAESQLDFMSMAAGDPKVYA
jgi:hypothetical protein